MKVYILGYDFDESSGVVGVFATPEAAMAAKEGKWTRPWGTYWSREYVPEDRGREYSIQEWEVQNGSRV